MWFLRTLLTYLRDLFVGIVAGATMIIFHALDIYPEQWLAFLFLDTITDQKMLEVMKWSAVAVTGILAATITHLMFWYFSKHDRGNNDKPTAPNIGQNLRLLSNIELQQGAYELTHKMRVFEANYRNTMMSMTAFNLPRSASDEQRDIARKNDREIEGKRRDNAHAEFSTRIRPDAVAMREEISRRIGVFPPYDTKCVALDDDMLAGVAPVTEAADLIDSLARRLT